MNKPFITIFTPTYNRKSTLKGCFYSLQEQTIFSFIWQIIDDGSNDGTEELVRSWMEDENRFCIEYIKVDNGGKARAINKSVELTKTELWMCLDSDDVLTNNAIESISAEYQLIIDREDLCGLFSLRGKDAYRSMQGVELPKDLIESTQGYIRYCLKIPPEYLHVFKTKIISQYKYPEINGERYFPLSYVFDQIDTRYKYKLVHKPLMICEYRKDGLTKNKRVTIAKNPKGYALYKKQLVKLAPTNKDRYKAVATYVAASLLSKANPFKDNDFKILTMLLFPVGLLDYFIRYRLSINIDFEIDTRKI